MTGKTKRNSPKKLSNKKVEVGFEERIKPAVNRSAFEQPSKAASSNNAERKPGASTTQDISHTGNDIKWIFITTAIVLAVLVIAYILLR